MKTQDINVKHYNNISEAWPHILGDNFHWGYFNNKSESLEDATYNLIDKLINLANINKNSNVLDIGCGIGAPAAYLADTLKCSVTGISNSENGIQTARRKYNRTKLNFEIADALDNKLPKNKFDVAWLLEMSHLIGDKIKLIEESSRAVKPGGRIILCDLILKRKLTAREILSMSTSLRVLEKSFGKASLWTLEEYSKAFTELNLNSIQTIDISNSVLPTIDLWKRNCKINEKKLKQIFNNKEYENFMDSCDILSNLYNNKLWGYGIIVANK